MLSERDQTEKYYRVPLLRHEEGESCSASGTGRGAQRSVDGLGERHPGSWRLRERAVVLPTASAVPLSAVSVTCRSEHIKWKIPEINNSHVLNRAPF